jgi:hypothetical protein
MDTPLSAEQLVWVTRCTAINPSRILEVFHGKGGEVEVYLPGRTVQFTEAQLTPAGRALLLPPACEPDAGHGAEHDASRTSPAAVA